MVKYGHTKAGCRKSRLCGFGVTSFLRPCWGNRTIVIRVLAVPSCLRLSTVYRVLPPQPWCAAGLGMLRTAPQLWGAAGLSPVLPCPGTGAQGRAGASALLVLVWAARAARDCSGCVGRSWEPAPAVTHLPAWPCSLPTAPSGTLRAWPCTARRGAE